MFESTKVIETEVSQASVAVAAPKLGVAGQEIGEVTVGQVMVGGVTSCTTIVSLQVEVLPQLSLAVQVRVML